ncbi:hypothetical protein QTP70_002572 [Hemibagrus guttatus]|uniref:Ig-like domain-containing protein n=1 Tax=Hemibagrus guttatus TaxID=175788 RepID=A0AAE0QBC4_9TELE|nr:hypothetical protein QTP70_002572 [Hemibagrus guttatus]
MSTSQAQDDSGPSTVPGTRIPTRTEGHRSPPASSVSKNSNQLTLTALCMLPALLIVSINSTEIVPVSLSPSRASVQMKMLIKVMVAVAGPTTPSVSLLPPSPLQLSEGLASLLCLLSGYSPQGALVSWTVDGSEVKNGVLTSVEEEKSGRYSRSSTLTLSKDLWEKGEEFSWVATANHLSPPIPIFCVLNTCTQ